MTAMLYAAGAAAVVVLGVLWRLLTVAKKSGVDQQKAKQQEAERANIERIKRAADAGARVQPDDPGVSIDPHNLDR